MTVAFDNLTHSSLPKTIFSILYLSSLLNSDIEVFTFVMNYVNVNVLLQLDRKWDDIPTNLCKFILWETAT